MARRKRKSKNHNAIKQREMENVAGKRLHVDSNSFLTGTKKMEKLFDASQKQKLSNKDKAKLKKAEKEAIKAGEKEYKSKRGLADGGAKTYFKDFQRVRKEIYYKFGIVDPEKIEHKHTKAIIRDRIEAGQSPNTIHKVVHAINFVQSVADKTGVYEGVKLTDHDDMLQYLKNEEIIRSYENSHRYKADGDECMAVIQDLYEYKGGKYREYADIAMLQFLSGGRRSEVIRLKPNEIDLNQAKVQFNDAKGGLDNTVWADHWTKQDKDFVDDLVNNAVDDKLFRIKDKSGNYVAEEKVAERLNRLLGEAAERVGVGTEDKNFTSHSLRGGYGHVRVTQYAKAAGSPGGLDAVIQAKIAEQPRLKDRYKAFEKHIRSKIKKENRAARKITDAEKLKWLLSVDLNHSRQDIARFYVQDSFIKAELAKFK